MGLDISDLATNTADAEVKVGTATVNVKYKPAEITTAKIETVDESAREGNAAAGFHAFLCDVLSDWDVLKDGKKVPLTPKGMSVVPMPVLRAIFVGLMQAVGSGDLGKASSSGSRRKATSATSRSSTRSSKRRATSA